MKPREWPFINEELKSRKEKRRFRTLDPLEPGREGAVVYKGDRSLVNFCSNDYLGLSRHPGLIERAREYAEKYGAGSTASRLVSGTLEVHMQLERKLAGVYGTEAALLFNSGFQANSSILPALTDRHSIILADKLSHNSLLQGALLSRGRFNRFEHNDMDHLEELLKQADEKRYTRKVIVTETVFSMDGDRSDLDRVVDMASRYNALLFVDDAHAVGVWGEQGLGLAKGKEGVDILLGTFGKGFGSFGAFVACSRQMRDYLVNFCPGFIYTTALPPPVIGAVDAALDLIPGLEKERARYHREIGRLRKELNRLGFDTGASSTQIIPLIAGSEEVALGLSRRLEEDGILATAIRPPTVPAESSRIRLTLTGAHTEEHINRLLKSLGEYGKT